MNPITFYQVANLSDQEAKDQFIVRKKEFERVISEIRRDDMKGSIQHFIYVGQRGSGKSTLLRRIQAEINTDTDLSSRLVVINLSEEQAGIYRLHDLWERVCQELQVKRFEVDEVQWKQSSGDLTDYAKALYMAMHKSLKQNGKKLVLLLDNIDRILESIKINDTHLFRELLMNYKDVRIIGGSTRLSEHHWKYDQPFYEFFNIIRLEPLTLEEMKELLLFWSQYFKESSLAEFAEKKTGRLNAVRILSDGMPRTMLNFLELLINRPNQQGYEYLRYIVDRATPVYQERLKTLAPYQQKVVLEMSFFWDAIKVKPLSHAARIESKMLSASLNQLVELQIVEKIQGRGKNMMYRLKERFFNFWLIMTQGGPIQKSQVKWLTIFLETWYNSVELKSICSHFIGELTEGKVTADQAVLMTKALVHSRYLSVDERDKLLDNLANLVGDQAKYYEFLPLKAREIFPKVVNLIDKQQFDNAQAELENIEQSSGEKYTLMGFIYWGKGNKKDALKSFRKAIKEKEGDTFILAVIADLYSDLNRKEEAEKYYLLAIEKGHVSALNNLAVLYNDLNRKEEAEKYYLLAIEKGVVKALFNVANLYVDLNRNEVAEKYYLLAIENGDASALYNLSFQFYSKNLNKEKAYSYIVQYNSKVKNDLKSKAFEMIVSLWTGKTEKLEEVDEVISKILESKDITSLELLILNLLVHHQKNLVWQWFKHEQSGQALKELARPLYYVTAWLINNEDTREELLAMAPELEETVNSIYDSIIEKQQFYYGQKKKLK
jgi:TPR repeat protein